MIGGNCKIQAWLEALENELRGVRAREQNQSKKGSSIRIDKPKSGKRRREHRYGKVFLDPERELQAY